VTAPSRRRLRALLLLIGGLVAPLAAPIRTPAQQTPPLALAPSPGAYARAVDEARTRILDWMDEVGTPGLSVAVGS